MHGSHGTDRASDEFVGAPSQGLGFVEDLGIGSTAPVVGPFESHRQSGPEVATDTLPAVLEDGGDDGTNRHLDVHPSQELVETRRAHQFTGEG